MAAIFHKCQELAEEIWCLKHEIDLTEPGVSKFFFQLRVLLDIFKFKGCSPELESIPMQDCLNSLNNIRAILLPLMNDTIWESFMRNFGVIPLHKVSLVLVQLDFELSRCIYTFGGGDEIATMEQFELIFPSNVFAVDEPEVNDVFSSLEVSNEILGDGRFGAVYKGTLNRVPVAVKKMKITYSVEESEMARKTFRSEAQLLRNCQHPGIVKFYGINWGNPVVIVMELAVCSLYQHLYKEPFKSTKRFDVIEKIGLLIECCDCFRWLHSQNIIHRDIKPANILLSGDNHCKIADFGLGKLESTITSVDGEAKGTLFYMSPELVYRSVLCYSEKTDVYSFAVTINEFLSEMFPFADENRLRAKIFKDPASTRPSKYHLNECNEAYEKMMDLGWHLEEDVRPTFSELKVLLTNIYRKLGRK